MLKVLEDGTIVIRNKADATKAMAKFIELRDESIRLKKQHGIDDMDAECVALKVAVTEWMVAEELDRLEISKTAHGTLIEQSYDSRWIATEEDMEGLDLPEAREVVPLKKILVRKFKRNPVKFKEVWARITKPVVVMDRVEEIVAEGIISVDEISPAFVEKKKRPYLRLFENGG